MTKNLLEDLKAKQICIIVPQERIQDLIKDLEIKIDPAPKESFVHNLQYQQLHIVIIKMSDRCRNIANKVWTALKEIHITEDRNIQLISAYLKTDQQAIAAYNGIFLSQYSAGLFKSNPKVIDLELILTQLKTYAKKDKSDLVDRAYDLACGQYLCMDLLNSPANKKTPQLICDQIDPIFTKLGVQVEIWDEHKSAEEGLHAFLSVNRGSEYGGRFVILDYNPDNAQKHIGLVGKGVTFDSGGISIKGSANLHLMKSDMGGSTAVLGAMQTIARQRLPIRVTAAMAFTDNAVDAKSIHPSDVIQSHAGHSIEIIDTDAEGRLCLADSLSYLIKNHQLDHIIDLATLTGSVVQTLGYQAAGLFTSSASLRKSLIRSSDRTGERVWSLPLWQEYKDDLDSDVADLRNFSGRKVAGAISAALFLERFTHGHVQWAHLDIAGVAFGDVPYAKMRGATGYGVHLIFDWIEQLVNS